MIKLASNAFLATKISFINEIANVCEEVGADVAEVARGMGLDERIGPSFLRAGIGYGGSCFPKDVSALKMLAGNTGYHFQLLNAVIEVNELQKRRVVGKLQKHLGSLRGKRIALLGLAFKPETDDMREASSLVLAARLQGEGAEVVAYDPVAGEAARDLLGTVELTDSAAAALEGADAAVLVTEWPEFAELDWAAAAESMARPLLIDGRNFLDPEALRAAGFAYEGIGRAVEAALPRAADRRVEPMQAIVLVGGEGTRLRPLTESVPKPALTLVDRPFLAYMVEWLAGHGVEEVVLACGFLPDVLREALGDGERSGVAHPLRRRARAAGHRRRDPLRRRRARRRPRRALPRPQRRRAHRPRPDRAARRPRGAAARERPSACTRSRTPPPTASSSRDGEGAVLEFLEKTGEPVPGEINAGMYALERSVLELIPPGEAVSIERDVFPRLAGDGLHGTLLDGYWMDIGTPERYLQATWDILEGRVETLVEPTGPGLLRRPERRGRRGARSSARGPWSAPRCRLEPGVEVRDSVLLEGCRVGAGRPRRRLDPLRRRRAGAGAALEGAVVGRDERVPA